MTQNIKGRGMLWANLVEAYIGFPRGEGLEPIKTLL